jgi:hypothetical protein
MALFSALACFAFAPEGFTNGALRKRVAALHDPGPGGYTAGRMTYDLRRLRLKGIVSRVPKSHRYVLTPMGRRIALFMTKTFTRVVRPVLNRLDPDFQDATPDRLRRAWSSCERALDTIVADAKLAA